MYCPQWEMWITEALGDFSNLKILYNPCPQVHRRDDIREKNVLFAGTIIKRKGYDCLIEAFSTIAHKYPDWHIVFAGNGELETARKLAVEKDIVSQVDFMGWVSGSMKELIFQKASIYCLASDGEGFPMALLDAWAYGILCVVTPVGGIPDIVTNEVHGLLFPIGDSESFVSI